jgi:hypothetical protein
MQTTEDARPEAMAVGEMSRYQAKVAHRCRKHQTSTWAPRDSASAEALAPKNARRSHAPGMRQHHPDLPIARLGVELAVDGMGAS